MPEVRLRGGPMRLYLLLGPTHLEANRAAYVKAKNLLHKIPVPHELIEEDAAEDFARELADYMRRYGIIVTVRRGEGDLAVPLSQLKPVQADAQTTQAVEDWHYWVDRGYEF